MPDTNKNIVFDLYGFLCWQNRKNSLLLAVGTSRERLRTNNRKVAGGGSDNKSVINKAWVCAWLSHAG